MFPDSRQVYGPLGQLSSAAIFSEFHPVPTPKAGHYTGGERILYTGTSLACAATPRHLRSWPLHFCNHSSDATAISELTWQPDHFFHQAACPPQATSSPAAPTQPCMAWQGLAGRWLKPCRAGHWCRFLGKGEERCRLNHGTGNLCKPHGSLLKNASCNTIHRS